MSRTGHTCPACQGIDTIMVLPGLLLCHDCGDEYELSTGKARKGSAASGETPPAPEAAPSSDQARRTEARVYGRLESLSPGYHSRPQPC